MVFTANAGIVVGDTFVPAHMSNPQRQGERRHFEDWFAGRGFHIHRLPQRMIQEGAGDALPFNRRLIAGHRTRSSAEASRELARALGAPITSLELHDERYYHLDLSFCPLDDEHAIVAPSAWSDQGRAAMFELIAEP